VRGSRTVRSGVLGLPYVLYAAGIVAALAWSGNQAAETLLLAVTFGVLQLLGFGYSLRAARHPRLSRADRRPWRYVTAAFGLLIASEAAFWAAYNHGQLRSLTALGLGTLIRMTYFLALLRGMFLFSVPRRHSHVHTWKLVLDITTVIGGGAMLIWYFLLGAALDHASRQPNLVWQAPLGYAIVDLVLVFGLCAVLLRGTATSARLPLILLLAGAACALVTDVVASYLLLYRQDLPQFGLAWQTILLPLSVALMMAAAIEQCREAGEARPNPTPQIIRRPTWLPYVALAVGFLLLIWAAVRAPFYPWWGLVFGATLMTLAVAVRQIVALRENHHLIITDNLTGLASRVHLRDTLRRLPGRPRQPVAVLQIDLDDFKRINDLYGHETGDAYLVAFARVLRSDLRPDDLAARLGGDEFAVLLNGVRETDEAVGVANRILLRAQQPIEIAGHVLRIRASVGIAVAAAADLDVDQLLHRADQAMYVAKRRQTHSWQLYAEGAMEDDQDTMRRLVTDAELIGQLRLVYQPIVALTTGDLVAVEALVRWQHPTRGLVPPLEFIPLAEEAGSIHEIGMWVIDESSRQVAAWRRRLSPGRRLDLTVNLSPLQLLQDNLAGDVLEALRRNDFAPTDFVAEVTEGGVVEEGAAIAQLEELRAQGVRIALDDFGTGYSSLRYLTRLPVDILKLDRCFVGELNGRPEGSAVAEAVVRLAQILHLDTVAEGIEDRDQATELTLHGYHNAQGFLFSRPLSAEQMDRVIDAAGDGWPNLAGTPVEPIRRPTAPRPTP
jgi:diguanylate cyclase (GGDEF)-like protein